VGAVDDLAVIGRPDRRGFVGGIEGEPAPRLPGEVVDPDVAVVLDVALVHGDPASVVGESGGVVIPRLPHGFERMTVSIHPGKLGQPGSDSPLIEKVPVLRD